MYVYILFGHILMWWLDVEEDPDDAVESDDAKGKCVTCYQASQYLDTHACVSTQRE